MDNFGKRLQQLRVEKGYTQTVLAKRLGLSVDAVRHWEQGRRTPNLNILITIANYFGVTVGQLVGTEEL